jgi:midasin (ATPase involved in ribosome maturation)
MSGDINEENEDQYEEGHGVDVKGDDREQEDDPGIDQDMQLDDDMDLNGDDDPVEMEDCENEEPDKDEENPDEADDTKELNFGSDTEKEEGNDDITDEINETVAPSGTADHAESEEPPEQSQEEEPKDEEITSNVQKQEPSEVQAHGIRASDGTEGILDAEGENDDEADDDDAGRGDTSGAQGAAQSQSDSQGGSGGTSEKGGAVDCAQEDTQHDDGRDEIPNPFKNPGDASKFWHKKLNIVKNDVSVDEEVDKPQENDRPSTENEPAGAFEYTSQEDENPMQVLGEAPEEEAVELSKPDEIEDEKQKGDDPPESNKSKNSDDGGKSSSRKKRPQEALTEDHPKGDDDESNGHMEDQCDNNSDDNTEEENADDDLSNTSDADAEHESGNRVVSDLSRLTVGGQEDVVELDARMIEDELVTAISSSEAAASRRHWLQIQGQTHSLSRRLCEKLRLVMEPLVASKLRGDYRTGKRINMKRVIGYIASGYRRDKIWLRRTKPAKRDYRVLLAVDDSESMKKSGAGEMALHALATLAMGMNQLEIGELGIASFGEDMKLLHPFHLPFGSESGSDMVMNFKFDQKRTRTSLCVESAIVALEAMGGSSSMQLVFLVSDGRIERDSRDKLKRLIREMMERNILLAMIIVEGEHKKKDSILNMKEVTFEKGKPVVKRFIEDYPFPYYIVLDDMTALPEILGDALRQWFEMLTHLPGPR